MRYISLFLMLCILLAGCANVGLDSQPLPVTQPTTVAPTTILPPPTTTAPMPTTVAPVNKPPYGHFFDEALKLDLPQLSDAQLLQICQDYSAKYNNSFEPQDVMLWFIGVFEDTYVLFIDLPDRSYLDWIVKDVVAGYTFVYGNSNEMEVYHEGGFYSLNEAYDAGYLTKEDVATLHANYYTAFPHFSEKTAE